MNGNDKTEIGLETVLRRIIREELEAVINQVNGRRDRLLDAKQATELMCCSEDYLYRRAKSLPFTRRVGRMLRFSERGILAYLDAKKPSKAG